MAMSPKGLIRIGLLEDHKLIRDGLTRVFQDERFEVLFSVATAEDFILELQQRAPDVAVIDVAVESTQGQSEDPWFLIKRLKQWNPDVRLVILASANTPDARRAAELGIDALIDKHSSGADTLLSAVEAVASGQRWMAVDSQLISSLRQAASVARTPTELDRLTAREREVLRYIAAGADNLKIAAFLDISERTVRAHVSSLYRKLGSENRAHLALFARKVGVSPALDV